MIYLKQNIVIIPKWYYKICLLVTTELDFQLVKQ